MEVLKVTFTVHKKVSLVLGLLYPTAKVSNQKVIQSHLGMTLDAFFFLFFFFRLLPPLDGLLALPERETLLLASEVLSFLATLLLRGR